MGPQRSDVPVRIDATDDAGAAAAAVLAAELGLTPQTGMLDPLQPFLAVTPDRVELRSAGLRPIRVDFVGGKLGYTRRRNRFGELFRAVGTPPGTGTVLDATAGFGQDAFLLALAGCVVTAVERSWVVAKLLRDGLRRAWADAAVAAALGGRLRVVEADARHVLREMVSGGGPRPDVVYLDPMYPPRRKSAEVRKEMRVLRAVVGDDSDAGELLGAARRAARRHVVVKRMRLAPELAPGVLRSYVGRTTRYDVYAVLDA